jgi:hypothetical protein
LEDLVEVAGGLGGVHAGLFIVLGDDGAHDGFIQADDEDEVVDVEVELERLNDLKGDLREAAVE